ncbi:hypothetical protein AB835_01925 [Candidatus Endobugula sertula]|uniref:Uncharacterized protein n=1 Tax=Candidatus Endobugula sertula TaxID=62101 RepID=A0A1D2QTB7_9GAMM|nr:hypothetical protein AB835_01925 [Candidatus Endobugula sertula]
MVSFLVMADSIFFMPTEERSDGGTKTLTGLLKCGLKLLFGGKDFLPKFERICDKHMVTYYFALAIWIVQIPWAIGHLI